MSYILDALKKAEADRDPDTRASLAIAQHDRRRNRLLIYGVLIALIVNAAVLLWLFFPTEWLERAGASRTAAGDSITGSNIRAVSQEPVVPVSERSEPSEQPGRTVESPAPQSAPNPPYSPPATTVPPRPQMTEPATTVQAMPDPVPMTAATGETIIRPSSSNTSTAEPRPLADLPTDVRRRFPDLNFSTHIYADEPDLRAVVVNGVRLEEGDRLENLRVVEITEEGAVFEFENRLVSISVLDAWN